MGDSGGVLKGDVGRADGCLGGGGCQDFDVVAYVLADVAASMAEYDGEIFGTVDLMMILQSHRSMRPRRIFIKKLPFNGSNTINI